MTREELYALVWARPMTHVSKDFGLSDVGLRKICSKFAIPTPPLGYWAKLAHGKAVKQAQLGPAPAGLPGIINLAPNASPDESTAVSEARALAMRTESDPTRHITIPALLPRRLHAAVAEIRRNCLERPKDAHGFRQPDSQYHADFKLGPDGMDRGMRILDTLAHAAEARGHSVRTQEGKLLIFVAGEALAISLTESTAKSSHIPTKAELAAQAKEEQRRSTYSYSNSARTVYPTWDYAPSGKLKLDIYDPNTNRYSRQQEARWMERGSGRIEDKLNDILASLTVNGIVVRERRLERERIARQAAEEAERKRLAASRAERCRLVDEVLDQTITHLSKLRELESLAAYINTAPLTPSASLQTELDAALARARSAINIEQLSHALEAIPEFPEPRRDPTRPWMAGY